MEQVECWMLCLVYTRKPAIVSEHFLNRMLKTIAHLLSELEVDMQNRDAFVSLFENTKCAVELQFEDQKLQHLLDVMLLIGCRIELELHQTGKKEFSQGDLDEIKALQSGLYEELPFSIPVTAGWL